jgi:isopentenyl phosphate kinase (EC 2.7.4.-)
MTTVLKLGGSVLTQKDQSETVDDAALATAARVVGESLGPTSDDPTANPDGGSLVLVHGGGSFGHPAAAAHGVSASEGTRDAAALADIHRAMGRLNGRVVAALHAAGVPALPVRPLSVVCRTDAGVTAPTTAVEGMLAEGFVPVLHGDVVVDETAGGTVCSGDTLVVALADALDADRVGVCSTVPGVLDGDGGVVPEITGYEAVADVLGGSDATDVTGGMAGKVGELLGVDGPASIFGLDDLGAFLESGQPGTTVR